MQRVAVVGGVWWVACNGHRDPPKLGLDVVGRPIADAVVETQADRQKRVEVALERVRRLMPKLAHIRELVRSSVIVITETSAS